MIADGTHAGRCYPWALLSRRMVRTNFARLTLVSHSVACLVDGLWVPEKVIASAAPVPSARPSPVTADGVAILEHAMLLQAHRLRSPPLYGPAVTFTHLVVPSLSDFNCSSLQSSGLCMSFIIQAINHQMLNDVPNGVPNTVGGTAGNMHGAQLLLPLHRTLTFIFQLPYMSNIILYYFRCTALGLGIYIIYKAISMIVLVPTWLYK